MSAAAALAGANPAAGPDEGLAVRTTALTKQFGGRVVVDGIDLAVPTGSVYGFLGPNGSGKTTTIRMLLGLVRPTSGDVQVLGQGHPRAAADALHRVGALVEGPAFHPYLSARANLRRMDAADRRSDPRTTTRRVDAALDRVGLLPAAGKNFRIFSLGMKQRLAIAATLLVPRDLLVLDEPTNGLDPQGTREVRHLVESLAGEGATILISSHLLSEIQQMCTHLGVMRAGRLVAQCPVDEFGADEPHRVTVITPDAAPAAQLLERLGMTQVDAGADRVTAVPVGQRPEDVVAALVGAGIAVRGFSDEPPSLEHTYVRLTGEGFDVRD